MTGSTGCASCRVCLQFLGVEWNCVWRTIRDPNFIHLWTGMPQKRTTRCHLLSASSYTPQFSLHTPHTYITPLLNRLWTSSSVFLSVASESAKVTWQQTQFMRLARLNMMLSRDCACPAFSCAGQTVKHNTDKHKRKHGISGYTSNIVVLRSSFYYTEFHLCSLWDEAGGPRPLYETVLEFESSGRWPNETASDAKCQGELFVGLLFGGCW